MTMHAQDADDKNSFLMACTTLKEVVEKKLAGESNNNIQTIKHCAGLALKIVCCALGGSYKGDHAFTQSKDKLTNILVANYLQM